MIMTLKTVVIRSSHSGRLCAENARDPCVLVDQLFDERQGVAGHG